MVARAQLVNPLNAFQPAQASPRRREETRDESCHSHTPSDRHFHWNIYRLVAAAERIEHATPSVPRTTASPSSVNDLARKFAAGRRNQGCGADFQ
jgi:hypothetical protein